MATTPKLNDTQLVILSQAAQRNDLKIFPIPASVTVNAATRARVLKSLLQRGFIAEKPAARADEEWRRRKDGRRLTLVIAQAGLEAMGIEIDALQTSTPQEPVEPEAAQHGDVAPAVKSRSPVGPSDAGLRAGTKGAEIIALLQRETGATLAEIMQASGWQAHSVRGFLSGTLKKKFGRVLISEKSDDGVRRYRIAA